jgi:hypothetical protein
VRRTGFPHHQVVSTVVLYGQENLGDHNQDAALGRGADGPSALSVGWVVARVVWGLYVSCEVSQFSSASSVWKGNVMNYEGTTLSSLCQGHC